MSAPIIAFGNQRLGTGTTTLVYHLAWMFADLNVPVLAVDLDPQSDLTRALVNTDAESQRGASLARDLEYYVRHGDAESRSANPFRVGQNLSLLGADLSLGRLEDSPGRTKALSAIQDLSGALRVIVAPTSCSPIWGPRWEPSIGRLFQRPIMWSLPWPEIRYRWMDSRIL